MVSVHYDGYLEDGITKVASSRGIARNSSDSDFSAPPLTFQLGIGQVLEGWDIAICRMSQGQISRVVIPPMFAYGSFGFAPIIPSNATLIYDIELITFKRGHP